MCAGPPIRPCKPFAWSVHHELGRCDRHLSWGDRVVCHEIHDSHLYDLRMAIVSSHKGPGRRWERVPLPTRIGVGTPVSQAIPRMTVTVHGTHTATNRVACGTRAPWTSASRQRIWMHRMLRDGIVVDTRGQRFCVTRNTKRSTDSAPATRWRKRRGSVSSPRHDTHGTEPIDIAATSSSPLIRIGVLAFDKDRWPRLGQVQEFPQFGVESGPVSPQRSRARCRRRASRSDTQYAARHLALERPGVDQTGGGPDSGLRSVSFHLRLFQSP